MLARVVLMLEVVRMAGHRHDPAVAVLRERYARGEISKEEFEAKLRDLESRP